MKRKATTSRIASALSTLLLLLTVGGCTSVIVNPMLDPLTLSLQKETDLELLQDGAPSLLLLLDGLIAKDPGNERLLMTATRAYGGYATIVYEEGRTDRAVYLSQKAKRYGLTLLERIHGLENFSSRPLGEIEKALDQLGPEQVDNLFWGAYGWATWIQFQEGAPAAMADLPAVEHVMQRVVALDESYYYGGAHIFLGSYYGSRPEIYGGQPEVSRKHFERALELNNRRFLLTQVAYAQTYARLTYNRELYLELLTEVMAKPLTDSDMASSNKLAKVKAAKLLDQVDEYF